MLLGVRFLQLCWRIVREDGVTPTTWKLYKYSLLLPGAALRRDGRRSLDSVRSSARRRRADHARQARGAPADGTMSMPMDRHVHERTIRRMTMDRSMSIRRHRIGGKRPR